MVRRKCSFGIKRFRYLYCWNAEGIGFETGKIWPNTRRRRACWKTNPLIDLGVFGQRFESEKLFHVFPGPAWYRKTITIPASWNALTPWLVFGGVFIANVWVNGHDAGIYRSYLTPFRINLSDYASPGESFNVTVRVDARRAERLRPVNGMPRYVGLSLCFMGALARCHLRSHVEKFELTMYLSSPKCRTTAEIRCELTNVISTNVSVQCEILDSNGNQVARENQPLTNNVSVPVLSLQIPDAKRWSPGNPYLYTAKVRLLSRLNGAVIDSRSVRFGMREFLVSGNKFLLNGQPFFLRGCGDDCIFPTTICPMDGKSAPAPTEDDA